MPTLHFPPAQGKPHSSRSGTPLAGHKPPAYARCLRRPAGATSGALVSMTNAATSGTDWYGLSAAQQGLVVSLSLAGALLGSGGCPPGRREPCCGTLLAEGPAGTCACVCGGGSTGGLHPNLLPACIAACPACASVRRWPRRAAAAWSRQALRARHCCRPCTPRPPRYCPVRCPWRAVPV